MPLKWFDARASAKIGIALAERFSTKNPPTTSNALQDLLQQADREVGSERLNFYKKAKLANAFKWKLLENGVVKDVADATTQKLVLHLSGHQDAPLKQTSGDQVPRTAQPKSVKSLLSQGNKYIAQGAYLEAIDCYQELIALDPRHAAALNNLGAALSRLGRHNEAESCFSRAIAAAPDFPDPQNNIGTTLLLKGRYADAEGYFRRAIKLNPRFAEARVNLGSTLSFFSQLRDAKAQFEKVLRFEPRNPDALFGMAVIAKTEGSFDQAAVLLDRALKIKPNMPNALAAQATLHKMTPSDHAWFEQAQEVAASGIAPEYESELRFAIGKYCDDVGDFRLAFENYQRANNLLKPIADAYDLARHKLFVDNMIRAYPREGISASSGVGSASTKPVFVIGMPRSGTSLTEQIIASHPSAKGAGEMEFWSRASNEHQTALETGQLSESTRNKLAEAYLRALEARSGDAERIVDKAPLNSDYLGLIHSVFPNARFVYMDRDPIDTCLSCYFQKMVLSLSFTLDLSDLANYYREHVRLLEHWRAVLPPGTILRVPYEELVADLEGWSRKITDFLDLEWDERVLEFHKTQRAVVTASFWQVRQKIYADSVGRWRNYERFIKPLLALRR